MKGRSVLPLPFVLGLLVHGASAGVVISEIHYNPPAGSEALEFVEISNDSSTPEDISGWAFAEGIFYTFEPATILPGRGILVVCLDAAALRARYGIQNAVGDFTGRLDSGGERITLVNQSGVVIQSVRYNDRGAWPVAPDGAGHSLALRSLYLDPTIGGSWAPSPELGGSPGLPNFASTAPTVIDTVLIDSGAIWKYQKGTAPFSEPPAAWRSQPFDDSSWLEGPSGFGYGDGDDRTVLLDMQNNYTSVAVRRRVALSAAQLAAPGDFHLAIDYDDGFIAWLNGAEIARSNCGAAGTERLHSDVASGSREAGTEDLFRIPRDLLIPGENLIAIAGYNFSPGSSDLSLIPRLIQRVEVDPAGGSGVAVVFNELYRGALPGGGWVELYNRGPLPADLSGYRITDDPDRIDPYLLPPGTSIPARGFLVIGEGASGLRLSTAEVRLFLLAPGGAAAAADAFNRPPPPGAAAGGYSECRLPDGGALDWVTETPTAGEPNRVPAEEDIVINEIFYHPPEDRRGEFVELYNRGGEAVDVSGFRFDRGIDYTITEGTLIPPGGYLVIAEDPGLMQRIYGLDGAQGPFTGVLANGGERLRLVDRRGNPVDEVNYADGGRWGLWADGGGSSLELIDPGQDNSVASAWDASDETAKPQWQQLSFQVPNYNAAAESELHLFLAERGICHLDDVSITRGAGPNLIPNPGFEAGTTPWIIQGTHSRSQRISADRRSGAACLELIATGGGDSLVNRIEVETSPAMTAGGPYEVSLWARWQRGSSLLTVHGEFTPGAYGGRPSPATNLSGNSLAASLRLTIPADLGTPGAENSVRRRLREENGSANLGPVIDQVRHSPPSPSPGRAVPITARVRDSDGVSAVRVVYSEGSWNPPGASVELFDDGVHLDGAAGDGIYGNELPGFQNGARVLFHIEAVDALGAARRYPVEAPEKTCLFLVQGTLNDRLDVYRVVLDLSRSSELQSRPLHSNDLLDGAFIFNNEETYYNVGVRYRGSPWGRPSRSSFRVRFEDDRPFHRGRRAVNISRSGGAANEGSAYFLVGRSSAPDQPVPTADYEYIRSWFNGASMGTQAMVQPVNREYMERWYGEGATGPALKAVGRIAFGDGGQLVAWDGAALTYRQDVIENYRGYFAHSVRESEDEWDSFMALCRALDRRATPDAEFNGLIDDLLDVETFFRVLAPRILMADWDAFGVGNGHNGYMARDHRDGRWELLPFDMDNSFSNPAVNLFPANDPGVGRLLGAPGPRRAYLRVLAEVVSGYWTSQGAGPFLDAVQRDTGVGTGGIKGFLDQSAANVRAAIQSSTTAPFRIITNSGLDLAVATPVVDLEGEAPVTAARILFRQNGGEESALDPVWTTPTRWKARFELPERDNEFRFDGFDSSGEPLGLARIAVRTSFTPVPPKVTGWFPNSGPAAGGTAVTFLGEGLTAGMKVLFGGAPAASVRVDSPEVAVAATPPAPPSMPADGRVEIEVEFAPDSRQLFPAAFTYDLQGSFSRGDSNGDRSRDIADPIAVLLYLFAGAPLACLDAADFDDSGEITIGDAVAALDYLFLAGAPPRAPYPGIGLDPTADPLDCAR